MTMVLRNADQFAQAELRAEIGQLWENWFVTERLRKMKNGDNMASLFFWRAINQREVDYI